MTNIIIRFDATKYHVAYYKRDLSVAVTKTEQRKSIKSSMEKILSCREVETWGNDIARLLLYEHCAYVHARGKATLLIYLQSFENRLENDSKRMYAWKKTKLFIYFEISIERFVDMVDNYFQSFHDDD